MIHTILIASDGRASITTTTTLLDGGSTVVVLRTVYATTEITTDGDDQAAWEEVVHVARRFAQRWYGDVLRARRIDRARPIQHPGSITGHERHELRDRRRDWWVAIAARAGRSRRSGRPTVGPRGAL